MKERREREERERQHKKTLTPEENAKKTDHYQLQLLHRHAYPKPVATIIPHISALLAAAE